MSCSMHVLESSGTRDTWSDKAIRENTLLLTDGDIEAEAAWDREIDAVGDADGEIAAKKSGNTKCQMPDH